MNKKSRIFIIISFVIIVGGSLYWSNITNWELYKNSEYGFVISIPENFRIQNGIYPINNSDRFSFSVVDSGGFKYFGVTAFNKPIDYQEPKGQTLYVLNDITGSRLEVNEEGGGDYVYFEFINNGKVWNIDFSTEGSNHKSSFDEKVYLRIKNSFRLLPTK